MNHQLTLARTLLLTCCGSSGLYITDSLIMVVEAMAIDTEFVNFTTAISDWSDVWTTN